ncbi:MAG: outer membrane lipoprotein carrier protein LolA [Flavobacteriales bacterium]|nr:outer membrane lipoprotein carrier protein LolA [Bacteroidota bacterium]MCB9242024.1 outer membrane lipoprotein carrier protein LolA [Flavobacteriales bacterium]
MKKLVAVSLAFLLAGASAITAQDQTATKILSNVSKTYKSYKTIKAGFYIDIKNPQTKSSIKQSGTLYLKGKKFRINMTDQEIYCDGKTMWTYFKEENEVQISKYDPNNHEINPSEIFTVYENGFDYKYTGETLKGAKKLQHIELTPQNKTKPYFKVKLSIDKTAHKIDEMLVLNKNGVQSTYGISSFSGNININDTYFKFDEKTKPGVVVIDLTK